MALIPCPDCGRIISDTAPKCIQCGRPTGATITAPKAPDAVQPSGQYMPPTPDAGVPPRAVSFAEPIEKHTFFPVSKAKFVVMSIVTFGMYPIYWSFKNWQRIRDGSREDLSPFWRAFWAPLWGFALFERIHEAAERKRLSVGWSAGWMGFFYLLLSVLWRLPDPWWLVSLLAFVPMIPVVGTIQKLHATEPAAEGQNGSYSGVNIAMIVLGTVFLVLALIGTFMPAEGT
jgi:hypothetical protein